MNPYLEKTTNLFTYLLIIVLFLLQIGYSYFISFGSLGLFFFYYKSVTLSKNDKDIINLLLVGISVILSNFLTSIKYPSESIVYERELRIFCLFVFLYLMLDSGTKLIKYINFDLVVNFFSISLFLIVIIQLSSRILGVVLLIPDTYYTISGDGALAYKVYQQSLDKGFDFHFRPTATYSEPSFLGLIICSLFFLSFYLKSSLKLTVCRVILVVTAVISTSLLGVCGIILLLLPRFRVSTLVFGVILIISLLLVYGLQSVQIDRLDLIFSGNDESLFSRLILPFTIIGLNFTNGDFFGTPFSINTIHFLNLGAYPKYSDPPFHNALLNIIVNFGLTGVFILYTFITRLLDKNERIFFIIVASQNGVLFDFNKVFILSFFILGKRYLETQNLRDDAYFIH